MSADLLGPRIETERMVLRPPHLSDAVYVAEMANDAEVARMTTRVRHPYRLADAQAYLAAMQAANPDIDRPFLIEHRQFGPIGMTGFHRAEDRHAELGYWLGRAHWGQGFGQEAAARLTSWALAELPINKITATIAADNEASRTILRRTGFRQVGEGRQIFQCRPGAKLPVLYFTMARETQRAAGPPAASLLLVVACALVDGQGRILLARQNKSG